MNTPTIIMAQLNFTVGDITGNTQKIIAAAEQAKNQYQADLIVYPELSICGYPPEDLVYRHDFIAANNAAVEHVLKTITGIDYIIGHLDKTDTGLYNASSYIRNGKILATYHKQELPNYGVFDEKRYYQAGNQACIVELKGHKIALTICEDLWLKNVAQQAKQAGADVIISMNASPYDNHKNHGRYATIAQRAQATQLPIIYVANVGGQDDLIYDGGSFAVDSQGHVKVQAPSFKEALVPIQLNEQHQPLPGLLAHTPDYYEAMYEALKIGLADYVKKNGFKSIVLGLSGGIDSALVLCVAVDALGPEKVHAVMLPSRYSAEISRSDALALCENTGVSHSMISIEPMFQAFTTGLAEEFEGLPADITEENLQARCRGNILMAISNKKGALLLSTGNKSEMAVGYCTLYGDMAGGYALIKDVFKMDVYALCAYRNALSPVIPQRIIDRPPSAELAPNQADQDTLPPYAILDAILRAYLEQDESVDDLVRQGYDKTVIERVIKLVMRSEHKRRQAAPGPKISQRAFARERRYPITCGQW